MGDLPSWAAVGAKVVCVDTFELMGLPESFNWPEISRVYTITKVRVFYDGVGINLLEVRNFPRLLDTGEIDEPMFDLESFAPLTTKKHRRRHCDFPATVECFRY